MTIKIIPGSLFGTIPAIPSKSHAQRVLIASALSKNRTIIRQDLNNCSNDIRSAINALNSIGARITLDKDIVTVDPINFESDSTPVINCGESGAVARFLLPVAAAIFKCGTISGVGNLMNRPFEPLCEAMERNGCRFISKKLPISFEGKMQPGIYKIKGNESSQYISGLIFALPLIHDCSEIVLTTGLESSGYVDMTIDVLDKFNVKVERFANVICLQSQKYVSPNGLTIEGDWSNSAYWLAAGVNVTGLNKNSFQKDSLFQSIKDLTEIDAAETPDLVPILSVYAAAKHGATRIYNTHRLVFKESDRIKSIRQMLTSLGADVKTSTNDIIINGKEKLRGGIAESNGDHRIAMSAAIAACFCEEEVIIKNAEAVCKSYPGFFKDYNSLGGNAFVI
ncbi:MAG: 3-phosphoshikimate 1-carboxyvinyltransferase [Defluviitaleaceae bacterium]|nr:3-phosphoshikimate 1-carboxyvinyltransferase [Defluviitaleaceae bacterium]